MKTSRPFLYIFLPLFTILSLWQAFGMQLIPDEAYYWLYAQNLDFGYFDHPPAIAVCIKIGYTLFKSEGGVRLISTLLLIATVWLLYRTAAPKNEWLFVFILLQIVPLHLLGCFALPDVPLLFFTALFFYAFRQYVSPSSSIQATAWLIVAVTGMFYSKYHAVLIIFFTLLASPSLLLRPSFYAIAAGSIVAYLPHIWWQVTHDFASARYHLSERSRSNYEWQNTISYLLGQWVMMGPLAGWLFVKGAYAVRKNGMFERVLWANLAGIFIFFLVSSVRGHVEPNWTTPCWIPLILLAYSYLENHLQWEKFLKRTAAFLLLVTLAAKAWLTLPLFDKKWFTYDQFHGWKKWATAISEAAGTSPVVFMNSYQNAAEYNFYGNAVAVSHNTPYWRGNQFDYWNYEAQANGKEVFLVPLTWMIPGENKLDAYRDMVEYRWHKDYYNFSKLKVTPAGFPTVLKRGELSGIEVNVRNYADKQLLQQAADMKAALGYVFAKENFYMPPAGTGIVIDTLFSGKTQKATLKAPDEAGTYSFYFCIYNNSGVLPVAVSRLYRIKVE